MANSWHCATHATQSLPARPRDDVACPIVEDVTAFSGEVALEAFPSEQTERAEHAPSAPLVVAQVVANAAPSFVKASRVAVASQVGRTMLERLGSVSREGIAQLRTALLAAILNAKRHLPVRSDLVLTVAIPLTGVALFALALPSPGQRPLASSAWQPVWAALVAPADASPLPQAPAPPNAARPGSRGAVQRTLNEYRDAVSILDVDAVAQVWPGVDAAPLRARFSSVYDQNMEFDSCRIAVASDTRASAMCEGTLTHVRRTRPRRRVSEALRWHFSLARQGDRWIITDASAVPR